MKHQVFILNFDVNPEDMQAPQKEKHLLMVGNLDDLNKLLEKGWLIDAVYPTEAKGSVKSFVYNLKMVEPSKAARH
jgi:hypothetical protein